MKGWKKCLVLFIVPAFLITALMPALAAGTDTPDTGTDETAVTVVAGEASEPITGKASNNVLVPTDSMPQGGYYALTATAADGEDLVLTEENGKASFTVNEDQTFSIVIEADAFTAADAGETYVFTWRYVRPGWAVEDGTDCGTITVNVVSGSQVENAGEVQIEGENPGEPVEQPVSIIEGQTAVLYAAIADANGEYQPAEPGEGVWTSSDPDIVAVGDPDDEEKGVFTGIAPGEATVTYTTNAEPPHSAEVKIIVTAAEPTPSSEPSEEPSVSPSPSPSAPSQPTYPVPSASARPSYTPGGSTPTSYPRPSQSTAAPTFNPQPGWTTGPGGTSTSTPAPSPSASATSSLTPSPSPTASPSEEPSQEPSVVPGINPDGPLAVEITEEDGAFLVTGVPVSTQETVHTASELLDSLQAPEGMTMAVLTVEGEPLAEDAPVATGCQLVVCSSDGSIVWEADIIVSGDVLGTGVINISQVVRMAEALNGTRPLTGIYEKAGDFNGQGGIDIADVVHEAQILNGSAS